MLVRVLRKAATIGFSVLAISMFAVSAKAALITNGSFESVTNGSGGMGEFDNLTYTTITGWTSSSDRNNYIFGPGLADTTGAFGTSYPASSPFRLWGPGDGSQNGLPATSPDGGNYIAADGADLVGTISQTISGLTPGSTYTLNFYWAGAQQYRYGNGPTTDQWKVTFGSQTQSTPVLNNADAGFTGWQHQTFTFTADGTTDLLSFLAVSTPSGVPPFVLLDGVSLTGPPPPAVAEPGSASLLLMGLGLLAIPGFLKSRKRLKI